MKPALLKTLAAVLIGALVFAFGGMTLAALEEVVEADVTKQPLAPGFGPLVLGPDDYFWGTTMYGGADNSGTIYRVKADGSVWNTVLSFNSKGNPNKGIMPHAGLIRDGKGYFWGSTEQGGVDHNGTLFKVNESTGELTTVVEFTDNGAINRGRSPQGNMVDDGNGFLWGTTYRGIGRDCGTVFKLDQKTGLLTTLVNFGAKDRSYRGYSPKDGLIRGEDGAFWGTTIRGWRDNFGTIFRVDAITGALTTPVEFHGPEGTNAGCYPHAGLMCDYKGSLWGTTSRGGGPDQGTVFKLNANTGILTTVAEFTNAEAPNKGSFPNARLVSDGVGSLWGVTLQGGVDNYGTVFKIDATTEAFTTVVEFTGTGAINKGSAPRAPLVRNDHGSLILKRKMKRSPKRCK